MRTAIGVLAILLAAAARASDGATAPIAAGSALTLTTTALPPLDAARFDVDSGDVLGERVGKGVVAFSRQDGAP